MFRNKVRDMGVYDKMRKQRETMFANGHVLAPADRVPRFVIPKVNWLTRDDHLDAELDRAIKQIDSGFEIIYDRFTATGSEPGHHLYRVKRGGLPGGHDLLIREFSLQYEPEMEWPKGRPRAPGWWIVPFIKSVDKARHLGDERHVNDALIKARMQTTIDRRNETKKKDREIAQVMFDEVIDPKFNRGAVSVGFSDAKPKAKTKPKTK